jgi:hypothetical protein
MSAFSALHVMFHLANWDSRMVLSRGMLKFPEAASNSRGICEPTVAWSVPGIAMELHPTSDGFWQRTPVEPLVQTHPQEPSDMRTLLPPFSQGVCFAHEDKAAASPAEAFFLGMTMRTTGMSIADTTRNRRSKETMTNARRDMPQQRFLDRRRSEPP